MPEGRDPNRERTFFFFFFLSFFGFPAVALWKGAGIQTLRWRPVFIVALLLSFPSCLSLFISYFFPRCPCLMTEERCKRCSWHRLSALFFFAFIHFVVCCSISTCMHRCFILAISHHFIFLFCPRAGRGNDEVSLEQ